MALVTETYPPEVNGVALTLSRWVEGLRAMDHRLQLVRPRQGREDQARQEDAFSEILAPGIPLPRYPGLRLGLPFARALIRRWKKEKPHLVHVATEGPLGLSALWAAKRLGIPATTSFHTRFDHYSRHYLFGLEALARGYLRFVHRLSAITLAPTSRLAQTLAQGGFGKTAVVGRGVDKTLFNPQRRDLDLRRSWGAADDDLVLLYVGRVAKEKNMALLWRAWGKLQGQAPKARLVVVGEGPLLEESKRLYGKSVLFTGKKLGENLARHYASADVFLFPSMTDTFGNVVLEAMASGLAVCAFADGAAQEHVVHGVHGLLAPLGDEEAFLEQALGLARSPAQTGRMGEAAARAPGLKDWGAVTKELEAILIEVIGEDQGGIGA